MEDYKKKYEEALERANAKIETYNHLGNASVVKSICEIFPEFKESEDERISKAIKEAVCHYWNDDTQAKTDCLALLFKPSKQKPVDKVELKFKIGDWIVSNRTNKTYKIDSIDAKDANYIIYSCVPSVYTNEDSPCFSESMIHLWTIQDAKDGDVLSFNDGHGNDSIELIKSITEKKIEFWFCLTNINRYEVFDGITPYTNLVSREDATPATKEQRNLLFSKMKETGYEWDSEKKELRKIEQKPAWSEEDDYILNLVSKFTSKGYKSHPKIPSLEFVQDWLKSLKERVQSQSN